MICWKKDSIRSTGEMEKEIVKQLKVRIEPCPRISILPWQSKRSFLVAATWVGRVHWILTIKLQGWLKKYQQSAEGSLQSRVNELSLNRFTAAQTFQSLTELLFNHIQTTYRTMIDTDKLLAADIVNAALVNPELDALRHEKHWNKILNRPLIDA